MIPPSHIPYFCKGIYQKYVICFLKQYNLQQRIPCFISRTLWQSDNDKKSDYAIILSEKQHFVKKQRAPIDNLKKSFEKEPTTTVTIFFR